MNYLARITQASWWRGENQKWATTKWSRDLSVCTVLLWIGFAIVYGTGVSREIPPLLSMLYFGHFFTGCVWWRRCLRIQCADEPRDARGDAPPLAVVGKDEVIRWGWGMVVCSLLLCIVLALVLGTTMPKAIGLWPVCLWLGHHLTAWIWIRRLLKIQRAGEPHQVSI